MSDAISLAPYLSGHRSACLGVFDSNVGAFLHADERPGFEAWLDGPQGSYFSLLEGSTPIGCGGFVVDDGTLRLTWGLLRADRHGRGLGELLLLERLVRGSEATGAAASTLGTTPRVEPFFARVGFLRTAFLPDGWGPGLDRVDLRLDLDPSVRRGLERRRDALRRRHGLTPVE